MSSIKVVLKNGQQIEVEKGTSLYALSNQIQQDYETPIMVAKIEGELKELYYEIEEPIQELEFLDLSAKDGMRVYQRSATFLMTVAAKELFPECKVVINHHITGGYFCEIFPDTLCTEENLKAIENKMKALVALDLPITKKAYCLEKAEEIFKAEGMIDKIKLLRYRRTSVINLYELNGVKDYFYGYMVPQTKRINNFKVIPYAHGFILQFPSETNPTQMSEFRPQPKLSQIFKESEHWARIMDVDIVGALNDTIAQGNIETIIRISEALHEKKIAGIADKICARPDTKFVLIAGPSSSGKTTFAHRLEIQLRVNGLKPHVISVDDYFVNREFTPKDEDGNYDFEALEAIDIELFNQHLKELSEGKMVELPSFNFIKGEREYKGNKLQLGEEDILIIEGIHGLNEKLTYSIPKANKFKVYISCLTQLNVDDHNRIPTTDTRLIRRMIRDNQYRGASAEKTMAMWHSVRRGENKNIFPFQEEADVMFNSVLIYELAVLKQKAEPLLFGIDRTSPFYVEAKRILKFLEYFLPVDTATIPMNSILREFVGGSCFH